MEINRKAHVSDATLIEFAGKEIDFLPKDLSKFTFFDPDLNQQKLDLLKTTYESALTYGTDKTQLGVLRGLTENLSAEFKNCISIFKDIRYFALKKFINSPATLKELGLNSYRIARISQPDMVLFMYELANTAEKYKTQLMAAGLKESVITSIKPAAIALEKCNVTQEIGKTGRSVKTEDRVLLLNTMYDILLDFSEAAKMVFAGDPLSRSKYILPYSSRIHKEKVETPKS